MNDIINFVEQYWGVALFGSVSVGSVVSFVVVQVKYMIQNRKKDVQIDALLQKNDELIKTNRTKDEETKQLIAKSQRNEEIMGVTFKAISYLVVASRLPIEDKLSLQADFKALKDTVAVDLSKVAKDAQGQVTEAAKEILDENADAVETIVKGAVDTASSLLDRYTKNGGD